MSTHADPSKSRLWLDGDGFRAPKGTSLPADVWADDLTGWDPFGGIQAGFTIPKERDVEDITIWNAEGAYRQRKGATVASIQFRAVDMSKATVMTVLKGGSVSPVGAGTDQFEWLDAEDEEFAFAIRVIDSALGAKAFYVAERVSLVTEPEEALNDDGLYGFDFELKVLASINGTRPIRKITNTNPLAIA